MARILIIESGDDREAFTVPDGWDQDDIDRHVSGMAFDRACVVEPREMAEPSPLRVALNEATPLMDGDAIEAAVILYRAVGAHLGLPVDHLATEQDRLERAEADAFLPVDGGEYGGGSM